MEINHEDQWVTDRLTSLEPQWRPNPVSARAMLDMKLSTRGYSWTWLTAAATAAVCLAAFAVPQTRAIAQQMWYRFVLNRIDVVRVDLSRLPLHMHITTNGLEVRAENIDQAEQKAGFKPYLPPPEVLDANSDLSVSGPLVVEQTINVSELESALAKVGATDVQVPPEWESLKLYASIGPMVEANYPGDVQVFQSQPIKLTVPPGLELERFAEVAFRSIGVPEWEARSMGQKFAAHPAWLIDIPADKAVNIQEERIGNGPALLIENISQDGTVERATVIRSTRERMYSVISKTRERSIEVAESLP